MRSELPKDDGAGWNGRTVLPSWRGIPTQAAAPALILAVVLLAVMVYLGSRIDGLRQAQATLESQVAALRARPSADPAGLDALAARLDASVTRIAGLEAVPRADPDVLAALGARVTALSQRTDALEVRPAGDPGALRNLASGLDAATARVAALAAAPRADPDVLAALGTRVTALSERADTLAARPAGDPDALRDLASGLDAAAMRVAALDTRVTALAERTVGLEARPPGDPAALDLLTAGLDATVMRIAALEATPHGNPAPIEPLEAKMTALLGRVDVLEAERTAAAASAVLPAATAGQPAGSAGPPGTPADAGWVVLGEIRFGRGSFALDPSAMAAISAIAKEAVETSRWIVLRGYADRVGNPVFNQALSLRRAIAVQLALIDHAVPTWQFHSVDGYGEDALPVRTGDGKSEPGNRIVMVFGGTGPVAAVRPSTD